MRLRRSRMRYGSGRWRCSRRRTIDGRLLSRTNDPSDRLTDGDLCAFSSPDSRENAIGRRFHFDYRFVGFDLEQRFAFGNVLAFLFAPGDELAGFLRHLKRGHDNAEGHSDCSGAVPDETRRVISRSPGTTEPGFHIPPLRGWSLTNHGSSFDDGPSFSRFRFV